VLADPVRLEQVLVNLLTNAAKYTDPGGRIEIAAERVAERARITIKDSGIGIEPSRLQRVFELFEQGERGLDRAKGGLGIGLTIVKRLVELHGGAVQARSGGHRPGQRVRGRPAPGAGALILTSAHQSEHCSLLVRLSVITIRLLRTVPPSR
jgi:signal transduction histidine kinase